MIILDNLTQEKAEIIEWLDVWLNAYIDENTWLWMVFKAEDMNLMFKQQSEENKRLKELYKGRPRISKITGLPVT